MTDLQQAARKVAAAKLIADVVKAEGDAAKATVEAAMESLGVERLRGADDAGGAAGTLTRSCRRPAARVTDEAAFFAWVAQRYPSEVVSSVRESFRDRLLFAASQAGDPVDAQGEVIPGVEIVPGASYVSYRPAADAKGRMRDLLRSSGLLALTAAPEPGQPGGGS